MGTQYKKIQFVSEGAWGSSEKNYLIFKNIGVSDYTKVFLQDDRGISFLFGFCSWYDGSGIPDMETVLAKGLTDWQSMEDLTTDEIKALNEADE